MFWARYALGSSPRRWGAQPSGHLKGPLLGHVNAAVRQVIKSREIFFSPPRLRLRALCCWRLGRSHAGPGGAPLLACPRRRRRSRCGCRPHSLALLESVTPALPPCCTRLRPACCAFESYHVECAMVPAGMRAAAARTWSELLRFVGPGRAGARLLGSTGADLGHDRGLLAAGVLGP